MLAYTRIVDADDDDLSSDPPAPVKQSEKKEGDVRFRVRVALQGGQQFTMTRRLKGFDVLDDQELSMQMDVVDAEGRSVVRVDPIVFRLVREALGEGEGAGEGLATPSPSPLKKKMGGAARIGKEKEKAKKNGM